MSHDQSMAADTASPPGCFDNLADPTAFPNSLEAYFRLQTNNACDKLLDEKRRSIAQKPTLADLAVPTRPWRARGR